MSKPKAAKSLVTELLKNVADERSNRQEMDFGLSFLTEFGYLDESQILNAKLSDILAAVKMFQQFYGLSESGLLDTGTVRAMTIPRCGCVDLESTDTRRQRLRAAKALWRKRNLLYFFEDYVGGLSKETQEALEEQAWKDWSDVADITATLTRDRSKADIIIGTGRGRRSQFDGPGNTLAWAYLPDGRDGQLVKRYDLDEVWVEQLAGAAREILYRNVACHESGHLLGLEHSKKNGALMAPYYSPNLVGPQKVDDIPRIQAMYGPSKTPSTPPAPPVTPPTTPPATQKITIEIVGGVASADIPGFRVTKFGK